MKNGNEIYRVPALTELAQRMKRKGLVTEQDALKEDITADFHDDIDGRLENFHPIIIHIRGEVSTSKSTTGGAITEEILEKIKKLMKTAPYKEKIKELQKITNNIGPGDNDPTMFIFSDQTEFSRFIKKMWAMTCTLIDENNRYSMTGYSASSEETTYSYYSDTFAQLFTHRILCSPSIITDVNSYLVLDVIGRDIENKMTKLKASYRDTATGEMLVLGHIKIDVSGVLEKDWYKRYRERKFRRFELLAKHGKRDVRELEFDHIALKVFENMKKDSEVDKISTDEVAGELDIVKRQEGRIYSILTDNMLIRKANTIIGLHSQMKKAERKYIDMAESMKGNKIPEKMNSLRQTIDSRKRRFEKLYEEMKKMSKLYDEYMEMR